MTTAAGRNDTALREAGRWNKRDRPTLRLLAYGLTVVFLLALARDLILVSQEPTSALAIGLGNDYRTHMEIASRVLAGGPYYNADQFAPYPVRAGDSLYPPVVLYLLVPISLIPEPLRSAVWWLVPLAITATVVVRHRPALWAWPILAACLWFWRTPSQILHGNIVMWFCAAIALGTIYRWPAVFALLKVTIAPFALIGSRARSWWLSVGVLALLSLPFLEWTLQYPLVLANLRGSPSYSIAEWPLLAIPVVAWLGRR